PPVVGLPLGRRPAAVLVGEDDLIQIGGDRHFVLREIAQPSPLALHGIRQQRQNLPERHGDLFLRARGLASCLRTVINPQTSARHANPSAEEVPAGAWTAYARRSPRRVSRMF